MIELLENEQQLFDELIAVEKTRLYGTLAPSDKLARNARKLYLSLKKRGHGPRFIQSLINNRGVPPSTVQFYKHIHAIEDLLQFIRDPDSVPTNLSGEEFKLSLYSMKLGVYIDYYLVKRESGWSVQCTEYGKPRYTVPTCVPDLQQWLQQDDVSYPNTFWEFLEKIWTAADTGKDRKTIQKAFDALAKWVSKIEKTRPKLFNDAETKTTQPEYK